MMNKALVGMSLALLGCSKGDEPSKAGSASGSGEKPAVTTTKTVEKPPADEPEKGLAVKVTRGEERAAFSGSYDGTTGIVITSYDKKTVKLATDCPILSCEKMAAGGKTKMGYTDDKEVQSKCANARLLTIYLGKDHDPLPRVGTVDAKFDTSKMHGISAHGWLNPGKVEITKSSDTAIAGTIDYKDNDGDTIQGKFWARVCK